MKKTNELVVTPKSIVDDVLVKITQFEEAGELVLPKDYSAVNALKSAYLILSEKVNKDNQPVLQSCSRISIANTLLNMVVQGLSPMKNQCYFIAYGDKLALSRSYLGSIAIARRVGLKSIIANVVFDDDEFSYKIDSTTGLFSILEHSQELPNIDITKIRGAYAITTLEDGTSNVTVMTLAQIKTSWLQGYAKGKSGAHTNFTDEMCKKTVINRACKIIINSSTDIMLVPDSSEENDLTPSEKKGANVVPIEIVPTETLQEPKEANEAKPNVPKVTKVMKSEKETKISTQKADF